MEKGLYPQSLSKEEKEMIDHLENRGFDIRYMVMERDDLEEGMVAKISDEISTVISLCEEGDKLKLDMDNGKYDEAVLEVLNSCVGGLVCHQQEAKKNRYISIPSYSKAYGSTVTLLRMGGFKGNSLGLVNAVEVLKLTEKPSVDV